MEHQESEEAFITELTAHQPAIQAFIVSLMPGDPDTDEVMQRTNLVLWRKRDSFTPGTNFRAWAFECAKWTIRAYLKEKRRSNWLIIDDDLTRHLTETMMHLIPSSPNATQTALRLCLQRLRSSDRELLLSHYQDGESLSDFARRAGTTPGTLKVTLFRLRAALRRCISDRLATGKA